MPTSLAAASQNYSQQRPKTTPPSHRRSASSGGISFPPPPPPPPSHTILRVAHPRSLTVEDKGCLGATQQSAPSSQVIPTPYDMSMTNYDVRQPAIYPAPYFFPFHPIMHHDFMHMPFDSQCSPDATLPYAIYHPSMQVILPAQVAALDVGAQGDADELNNLDESTSPVDGSYDPPSFGPGPPIVTGDKLKGPRGCNLFVFHLPNEITNWDLYLLFRRHGTILSVHIMVNKATGLSKGYGFVSYAHQHDAVAAIEAMDGFRLGKKRLKVQLKRLQDDSVDIVWEEAPHDSGGNSRSDSGGNSHGSDQEEECKGPLRDKAV